MTTPQSQNLQIDPASGLAINCHNCIHCARSITDVNLDKCLKAGGVFCGIVHLYPSCFGNLCKRYSAWAPRPPKPPRKKTIRELISDKIRKMLSDK